VESLSEVIASWQPEPTSIEGSIDEHSAREMSAFLGVEAPRLGDPLPWMWQEGFLREPIVPAQLGADGHSERAPYLPPLPSRRRLFGGARMRVERPLRIGDTARHEIEVAEARETVGRSGPLLVVTERHRWTVDGQERIVDDRQIVYRSGDAAAPHRAAAPADEPVRLAPVRRETFLPDGIRLFTFSALTRNPHRIHYDRDYAREAEGHPDLLVHGPLTALLALLAAGTPRARGSLSYRLLAPAYVCREIAMHVEAQPTGSSVVGYSDGRECIRLTVSDEDDTA
jgi:hydroxyacyl-ACP dehydratase HTD2-like protein with hotdog domain